MGKKTKFTTLPHQTNADSAVVEPARLACLVCKKQTRGYGIFADGFVCSRACNDAYEQQKSKLIDYSPKGGRHEK